MREVRRKSHWLHRIVPIVSAWPCLIHASSVVVTSNVPAWLQATSWRACRRACWASKTPRDSARGRTRQQEGRASNNDATAATAAELMPPRRRTSWRRRLRPTMRLSAICCFATHRCSRSLTLYFGSARLRDRRIHRRETSANHRRVTLVVVAIRHRSWSIRLSLRRRRVFGCSMSSTFPNRHTLNWHSLDGSVTVDMGAFGVTAVSPLSARLSTD